MTGYAEGTIIDSTEPGKPSLVMRGGKWTQLGSQAMMSGLPQPDQKALEEMNSELQSRQMLADRAGKFMAAQGQGGGGGVATGPGYGALHIPLVGDISPGRALQNVIDPKRAAQMQALDAINSATWTALRPTGSGPIRNFEAAGWKRAFPSTQNFGVANSQIAKRLGDEASETAAKVKFVQDFIRAGKGSVADALAAYKPAGAPAVVPAAARQPGQPFRASNGFLVHE